MKTKSLLLLLAFIIIFVMIAFSPLSNYLTLTNIYQYLDTIKNYPYTWIIYILIYVIGVVFIFPGFPLTLLAVPLFGFYRGVIYVMIAANLGCQLTFIITRYFATQFIKERIKDGSLMDKMNHQMKENGFIYVLTLRAIPIFPFSVINYISGLTPISYKDYSIATFIGLIPTILLYTYFSYSAISFQDNPLAMIIASVLVVLFVILSYIISKKVKSKDSTSDN